jgi:hypothetical protein
MMDQILDRLDLEAWISGALALAIDAVLALTGTLDRPAPRDSVSKA